MDRGLMGLDATIYCDCFERGCLRDNPPTTWRVRVAADGSRCLASEDRESLVEFRRWNINACKHERGVALHHRIGTLFHIAELRSLLGGSSASFPVILTKVIYDGIHSSDQLNLADVKRLQEELTTLAAVTGADQAGEEALRSFEETLRELAECSLRLQKPIAF